MIPNEQIGLRSKGNRQARIDDEERHPGPHCSQLLCLGSSLPHASLAPPGAVGYEDGLWK